MMENLADVPWERLESGDGTAEEVPHRLRARRYSTKPDWDLLELLCHRDGVYPSAVAALPFLLDLASDEDTPGRELVLANLAGLAARGADDPEWSRAWERERPRLLALVEDDSLPVRLQAWNALRSGRGAPGNLLEVLRRRWSDVDARLDVVLAAGSFTADDRIAAWLREVPVNDPAMRLAVGYALRLGVGEFVPGLVGDRSVWQRTGAFPFGPVALVERFAEAFADRPHEHAVLLGQIEPHLPKAFLHNAGVVLGRWRSPQAELLEIAASRLTDPDPDVRYEAVFLIGCARAEEYAQDVAALREDDSGRSHQTVADAVAWTLARCGRRVPDLVRRLRPFEPAGAIRRYSAVLPSLGQTLRSLETDALPDVAELVALLDTVHRPAAVRALGRIGAPVPELAPVDPGAAWAWWRCGGDAVEAAAVVAAGEIDLAAVRMLADLGPAAQRYVDLLPWHDERAAMRVATRQAHLAMTGEQADLVEVCQGVLTGLPHRFEAAMIPAVPALAEAGVLPEIALDPDRRYSDLGGWRAFDQDARFRAVLQEAVRDRQRHQVGADDQRGTEPRPVGAGPLQRAEPRREHRHEPDQHGRDQRQHERDLAHAAARPGGREAEDAEEHDEHGGAEEHQHAQQGDHDPHGPRT
jgi:hypothetical protein